MCQRDFDFDEFFIIGEYGNEIRWAKVAAGNFINLISND